MEPRNQFSFDGQEVEQGDLQQGWDNAAFADDHVFAELFRMLPATPISGLVARGVMPFGVSGVGATGQLPAGLIAPDGATGKILVAPFRAFIGSRTLAATDGLLNWRDIRSGLSVIAGSTALAQSITIAPNASGNPRIDRVVAQVTIDNPLETTTRWVKDTTDADVTPETVVETTNTSVVVQVIAGTPAASPTPPAITADSGSTYYVELGLLIVPNGFGSGSTVTSSNIFIDAPCIGLEPRATGAMTMAPADYTHGAAFQAYATWRASAFLPSTKRGGVMLEIPIDLSSPANANTVALASPTLIDASRDWRKRTFRCDVVYHASALLPDDSLGSGNGMLSGKPVGDASGIYARHFAASVYADTNSTLYSPSHSTIVTAKQVGSTVYGSMPNSSGFDLVVDQTDGKLYLAFTTSPSVNGRIWILLQASAQHEDA
ncbi:MAG TPA: hypothetical protein VGH28_26870 [Polyangiaceae bacterium]|jgi:hypothetical protein